MVKHCQLCSLWFVNILTPTEQTLATNDHEILIHHFEKVAGFDGDLLQPFLGPSLSFFSLTTIAPLLPLLGTWWNVGW